MELHRFKSTILRNERRIWVYTPAEYAQDKEAAPLLIFFDGWAYLHRIPTPTILDNLQAQRKIQPTVALFVDHPDGAARQGELHFDEAFVRFLAEELVPWARKNYRVVQTTDRTVLCGLSAGGLTAAFGALRRPDIFGKVISQSGAFWWWKGGVDNDEPEWLARQFAKSSRSPLSFYLDAGLMEDGPSGLGTSLLAANRHLRDVLQAKGYPVQYQEFYGGHDPVHWRDTLADGLVGILSDQQKLHQQLPH